MITVIVKLKMCSEKYIPTGVLNYNFKCSILANNNRYIAETSTLDTKNIVLNKETIARVKICYAETDLTSFLPPKTFDYVVFEKVGEAEILMIEELTFETDITDEIEKERILSIFEKYME